MLSDVFGPDFAAQLSGSTAGYRDAVDGGVSIRPTDRPDLCLAYLGR